MDYAAVAARAFAAITRNGVAVTVKRYVPSVDATTGVPTKGAATLTAAPMAVMAVVAQSRERNSQAKKKVKRFYLEAVGQTFEPKIDDEITEGGSTWLVLDPVETYSPAGTAVLYVVKAVEL
jgi:hypothetical protein